MRLNCIFEGKEGLAQCVESKIFLARQKQGDVENINIEFREMSGVSVIINSSFNERINAESMDPINTSVEHFETLQQVTVEY